MDVIYHLIIPSAWALAQAQGEIVADSLATEGFIHCSRQAQLLAVAERFFAGVEEVLVLAIDASAVAQWLVNEGPQVEADPFAEDLFPHVYAPIPIRAVMAVAPLRRDDMGRYVWPATLARI